MGFKGVYMRKIAILTKTWSNNYFMDFMEGVNEYIKDKDIRVDVFNAYDIGSSALRSKNELSIHSLPVPSHYESLIIFINSDGNDYEIDNIIDSFVSLKKPVISIDRKIGALPYMSIDNYASEYELVEHMIVEHGCKLFQYIGGTEGFFDNVERYRALKDCLEHHGLTLDENYVSYHNFMEADGIKAYEMIRERGLRLPDCVISANDNMAVGYVRRAEKDGFYAPRDYKICGFDNVNEGQKHYPSITSVNKNISQIAYDSLRYAEEARYGAKIPSQTLIKGRLQINDSCGCNEDRDIIDSYRRAIEDEKQRDRADRQQRDSRGVLCACKNFEELQRALDVNYSEIGLYEVAACIKDEVYKVGGEISPLCYSEKMRCYTASSVSKINRASTLIPDEWKDRNDRILVYSPFYFNNDILGYCIMPYKAEVYDKRYHEVFVDSISIAIENIRQKMLIDSMNQRFKELYVVDQMTGLYNRFGYSAMAGKLFGENKGRVYIVYVDIDNLKKMNDNYGHDIGDLAIKGAALCIRNVFDDTNIHVRMGGDEFLIMGKFISEEELLDKERRLLEKMNEYTKTHKLPVPLEASIGHSFNVNDIEETELEKMLKSADSNMYEIKQRRKKDKGLK